MIQPLTIWCDTELPADEWDRLDRSVSPHTIVRGGDVCAADVAFGQPPPAAVMAAAKVKWVHVSSAGYTRYDTPEFRAAIKSRGGVFTNSSAVYDQPCAQHVAAMLLAVCRRLPAAIDVQRTDRGWPGERLRRESKRTETQSVLIYGYGSIARRLVEYLRPFGMGMTGVRRNPRGDETVPMIKPDSADGLLGTVDHVVNILPSSPATDGFFDARRFGLMKPTTHFYNIGRGATVDQPAMLRALQTRAIAGAYLDVTRPEPLPPEDPLWTAPNCYITPHSAGGHADEPGRMVDHFLANLRKYEAGAAMADVMF